MPLRNLQLLVVIVLICMACYVQAERLRYAGKLGSAIQLIEQNYVEERDPQDLYYAAMEGIVSKLDQFSAFIPPAQYEQFQAGIEQEFGGLGVLIEGPPASKQITVVAPMPGTPAFRAGLQPGDVVTQIAGQATDGMFADKASEVMRGPVGESIVLTIRRMGEVNDFDVEIERADIQVDSIYGDRIRADSSWDFFLKEDPRIAYIRINLFGERTTEEFEKALDAIQPQAQAVVLDLRYNPGGILACAIQLCDMLLDEGVVVSTRGRKNIFGAEFEAEPGVRLPLDIPMVVLVNQQSASASEILAGCLQDQGRAKIAGSRSFGKGTVQQVFPLDNDQTALKFTTARFYRPNGMNIHRTEDMDEDDTWGIRPEEELELVTTDLQNLYLNLRWRRNGDPRITAASDLPPAPEFAGDPQLKLVVDYLQDVLDPAGNSTPSTEPAEGSMPSAGSAVRENDWQTISEATAP